ncbi:MAG: YbhB/YbcL family Raf kinase inhibitor-like protein [Microbacteriaceae bacterium]|jgi:phosphatidylethanolamine-binding protein (PEBP) family uncharacterized protein|nr:YbhB/YbcL family Raf kinase inhibitor-like protein [Microbacteriaceae bacterium]
MHPLEVLLFPLGRAFRNRRAGEAASLANSPELTTDTHFSLTSPSFGEGQEIPARFCGPLIGQNVSPALTWGALPAGTRALVLLFEDIDGPGEAPRIHTVAVLASTGDGVAEGALVGPEVTFAPRYGKPGKYVGPRPLPGHGPHHYRFHLYAVDTMVDPATFTAEQLPSALAGHVLASGLLIGTRTS